MADLAHPSKYWSAPPLRRPAPAPGSRRQHRRQSRASRQPQAPQSGWPVFRYRKAELELKKVMDGESPATALVDWVLKHRFTQPGSQRPLTGYTYAEDAPADETVP